MSYVLEANKEVLYQVQKDLNKWVKEYVLAHSQFPSELEVREKFDELMGLTQLKDPFYEDWDESL